MISSNETTDRNDATFGGPGSTDQRERADAEDLFVVVGGAETAALALAPTTGDSAPQTVEAKSMRLKSAIVLCTMLLPLLGCGKPSPEKVCGHAADVSKLVDENDCKAELTKLQEADPQKYEAKAQCVLDAKNEMTTLNCLKRTQKPTPGEDGEGPSGPKWKVGQEVDVKLPLVADDKRNLVCASEDEVAERHCAFESKEKAWRSSETDDTKLLKPYTTSDHVQFLAAGLWAEPVLRGTLPAIRFTVRCKLIVEGTTSKAAIRWASDGPWYPSNKLPVGLLKNCTMLP